MKKSMIMAGLSCILAAVSCMDFLEEDLKSSLAPTNTYTSTLGFEVGSAGLYSIARSEYNTWGEEGAFIHNGACPYEALQIGTDIVVQSGAKDGSLTPFANLTMNGSTQFVKTYWTWAYDLINSANELLIFSAQNENWDYPSDKALYEAEARFFRAYAYRYLYYLYGDVPYVETIQQPFLLDFTRDPKAEILQHILDDLQFASENLPEDPDAVKVGKLTKWAALHLLSEMQLVAKDYTGAARSAEAVINSGYFSLNKERFGSKENLAKDGNAFSDMFLEGHQNRTSGNKESIWVMQFEYGAVGGGTNSDDWTRRAWNPQYYNINGFSLSVEYGGRGLAQIAPMKWWIGVKGTNATPDNPTDGIFNDGDIRNAESSIKREWLYNNPDVSNLYGQKCNITDATWNSGQLFPALTKFFFGVEANLTLTGDYKDRMKFRLAETYLLLAEAYLGQNDPQKAADAVNVVRRRAKVTDVQASEMDMDFLLDERIRELVGEEVRRFTLLRTGKFLDRVRKYNDAQKDIIDEHHLLWPIPQTIIDSNRDVEFPQNPGYDN